MPTPFTTRQEAISAYLSGDGSMQVIAKRFKLNPSTLHRWIAEFRQTGVVPCRRKGRQFRFSEEERHVLLGLLHDHPEASARFLGAAFAKTTQQPRPATSTVHLALLEMGLIWNGTWRLPPGELPPRPESPSAHPHTSVPDAELIPSAEPVLPESSPPSVEETTLT